MESQILYDAKNFYQKELTKIKQFAKDDLKNNINNTLGYIHYLVSDYKEDRWLRRDDFIQLHENLNITIHAGIRDLFYINGFYAPTEENYSYVKRFFWKRKFSIILSIHSDKLSLLYR